MTNENYEARAQAHLASLKRDMKASMEDAVVRAMHKVMAEFEAKSDKRLMEMPAQYSDIVSDGGLDPRNKFDQPEKFAGFDVVVDPSMPPGTMKFEQPARKDWGPGPHERHSQQAREPEHPAKPLTTEQMQGWVKKTWEKCLTEAHQEPEFITHSVDQPYDWSEWVCPDPKSYLMKCCDCGLVHEAQFGVVRYASEAERENCETVDDPNLQAVFRMRRSEQWSPVDTAHRAGGLPMEQPAQKKRECNSIDCQYIDGFGRTDCDWCREPEQPAQQEPVARTDQQIVDQTEELAEWLLGWAFNRQRETSTPMRESTHPMAERCWAAACHIQEMLTATDPENAVAELDDAPAETSPRAREPEQPAQQEPVGEVLNERGEVDWISFVPPAGTSIYTRPQAPATPLHGEPWPEEPAGHISGGVQPSSQPDRWVERWYGSTERGWWIVCGRDHIAHLGAEVSSEEVRKIIDAHNRTRPQAREPLDHTAAANSALNQAQSRSYQIARVAQQYPLTPDKVYDMAEQHGIEGADQFWYAVGVSDAEAAHGIKGDA